MKRRQFATFLLIPEKSSRGKMMKNEEEEEEKSSLRGRRFGSLEVHHSHNIFPNSPFFSLFKLYVVESRYSRQKKKHGKLFSVNLDSHFSLFTIDSDIQSKRISCLHSQSRFG